MQVTDRTGRTNRQVLIGMVVSKAVLGPISARWEGKGLFPSRWENLLAGWCIEHYHKYRKPPGSAIGGYLDRWAEGGRDKEVIKAVDGFLAGLSDEWAKMKKDVSADYVLDEAGRLFDRVRLESLQEQIGALLETGDVEKARKLVDDAKPVELGRGAGVFVLDDEAAVDAAFEVTSQPIITLPGAVGNFFGPSLERDGFISFMGKEKVGKSYWLEHLAVAALEGGRNVAWIEAGDMSQHQVIKRLAARAAQKPIRATKYQYPTDMEPPGQSGPPEVQYDWRESETDLTPEEAKRGLNYFRTTVGGDRLFLSCHPNSTMSVRGIEAILDAQERDGWRPDVVVVDYADILAPLDGRADTRDQINATWKALRAMSQARHCLVITATQTDTDSYDAKTLARDNFSEDKRKYAHVTGMVGINQTDSEKDLALYRLNWVVLRNLEFSEKKCVWCAACLAVGNPCVLSTF